jgi:hypothetical protein
MFGSMVLSIWISAVTQISLLLLLWPILFHYGLKIPISLIEDQGRFYLTWFSIRFREPFELRDLRIRSMRSVLLDNYFSMKVPFFLVTKRCIQINSYGGYFIYVAPLNLSKLEQTILKGIPR